ncbi:MAG: quaternary amine ABC transporter ATP-binding protein [Hyphomicrobiales bacterium]
MSGVLTIENLYKIFGDEPDRALELAREGLDKDDIFRRTGSVVAVDDVSFKVEQGQIFVVMGLSGSGKSTLIRCINRLITPTRGRVLLDGEDVTAASPAKLRQIRLKSMAMVFQHFALLPHKTVAQNVEYGLKVRGVGRRDRREKALAALERVGLEAWADSYPYSLSGGMQQRVGLARGLAVEPEVLLMDEPFSALDPLIRRDIQDQMLALQAEIKATIVFITHDLQEALKLGDQVAIMKEGRFVQSGTPQEIVTEPKEDYVYEFTKDVDRSRVLTFDDIMRPVTPVGPDKPAAEIRRNMSNGVAFVVDDAGHPLGVIDKARLDSADDQDVASGLMDKDFGQVEAGTLMFEAYDVMAKARPMAVVGEAGELVGTFSPPDVFAHLRQVKRPHDGKGDKDEDQPQRRPTDKEVA